MDEAIRSGHPTTEKVTRVAHETVDRVAASAAQAEERARAAGERMGGKCSEMSDALTGYVREHPMTSLGIAAAVGLVIGALLRRS